MVSVHALNTSDEGIVLNGNLSASAVIEETTRKRELRLLKNRYHLLDFAFDFFTDFGHSVCVLFMTVSLAKTAKLIEMPFEGRLLWIQGTMYSVGVHIGTMWHM